MPRAFYLVMAAFSCLFFPFFVFFRIFFFSLFNRFLVSSFLRILCINYVHYILSFLYVSGVEPAALPLFCPSHSSHLLYSAHGDKDTHTHTHTHTHTRALMNTLQDQVFGFSHSKIRTGRNGEIDHEISSITRRQRRTISVSCAFRNLRETWNRPYFMGLLWIYIPLLPRGSPYLNENFFDTFRLTVMIGNLWRQRKRKEKKRTKEQKRRKK